MTWRTDVEPSVLALRDAAIPLVQDERGVRVEDYLTVLAAATGEAAIVSSGVFDIEHNDLVPGAAVFGDAINEVLTGDGTDVAEVGPMSVVGTLRDELVPDVVDLSAFGSLEDRYRHVAATVGDPRWGDVDVRVPADHHHAVLPLQAAFHLRPVVVHLADECDQAFAAGAATPPDRWGRHTLCALALASAIEQTAGAIDVRIGLDLALDVVFGMAKMVPMSRAAFDAALDGDEVPTDAGEQPSDTDA